MKSQRADQVLVRRGLAESRSEAQKLIMAGRVRVGSDHLIRKASQTVAMDADLRVDTGEDYVSRGALKLKPALDTFTPPLAGTTALDLGASTGGFTDLLLQRGVAKVYAVDVGYGQLHYRLRNDPRVVCLERTNARYLGREEVPDPIDILTADVAFISLEKVLPAAARLLKPGAWVFTLVKPQFEASREEVGKGGVVRDETVREACVERITTFCTHEFGWASMGVIPSPITGPKGNQEFITVFKVPERV